MNKMFSLGLCAGLCAVVGSAQGADSGTETRPVDARVVRVRLDGAVDLKIRQGNPPSLTLSGDARTLPKTVTTQDGDTLSIDNEGHAQLRFGMLRAELVLPALREVTSESLGKTEVSGFSGERLVLSLDGAGSMRVAGSYRIVTASLGGVGSLRLQDMNSDQVQLDLQGAGIVQMSGRVRALKADMGGLGSLDAQQCSADTVDIDLSGLGNASVTARQSANLSLSGMGSVTVYGKPANRRVEVDGLGKVSWK